LNIWIQSDLGALFTLARGAASGCAPPLLIPPLAHPAAATSESIRANRANGRGCEVGAHMVSLD
jgi:hypothetical protein